MKTHEDTRRVAHHLGIASDCFVILFIPLCPFVILYIALCPLYVPEISSPLWHAGMPPVASTGYLRGPFIRSLNVASLEIYFWFFSNSLRWLK